MIPIPSPLHPAVVHFPIVLILIGTAVALIAVFVRRWHLPLLAAILLTGGAAGAVVATWTGGEDEEMVGELSQRAEGVLEKHEEWGEFTRNVAIGTAVLALAAAALVAFPKAARGISLLTALAAVVASYGVAQTGHYGGQLVYKNGVGINTSASTGPASGEAPAKEKNRDDDDD